MNRITTERLDELIRDFSAGHDPQSVSFSASFVGDALSALRELLAYRKAVKEYLEALDGFVTADVRQAALATLRALEEKL